MAREAARRLPTRPVTASEKLRDTLVAMKKAHPGQEDALHTCWRTLGRMVANVGGNPGEEKFRKVRLGNPAIAQRVVAFEGAVAFLEQCGFVLDAGGEVLELPACAVDLSLLQAAAEQLDSAINNPFFGAL